MDGDVPFWVLWNGMYLLVKNDTNKMSYVVIEPALNSNDHRYHVNKGSRVIKIEAELIGIIPEKIVILRRMILFEKAPFCVSYSGVNLWVNYSENEKYYNVVKAENRYATFIGRNVRKNGVVKIKE